MNWQTIRVLFANEIRMLLRDRRTIVVAIVLPLLLYPVMFYATKTTSERREKKLAETVYQYALAGSRSEEVRVIIRQGQGWLSQGLPRKSAAEPQTLAGFKINEQRTQDPGGGLKNGQLHFYLEALSAAEADALQKQETPAKDKNAAAANPEAQVAPPEVRLPGVPLIRIHFQGDRDASQSGAVRMRDFLTRARRFARDELLRRHGFAADPGQVMAVEQVNVASAAQVTGSTIGRFLTLFVLLFLLSAGSIVALDSIAGEKERGSLETLLTTAARRSEIVAAKQLLIVTVATGVTLIQMANFLAYVTFKLIRLPESWVLEAPPGAVIALLVLFLPMAAFTASVLLMLSAYAKSYKEAQLYFFPVYLVSMVPALAGVLPGVALRSAIVMVPVANVSVAVREIMVGRFDWPMLALVFLVMCAAAAWAVRASANMLTKESLITASETGAADLAGGAALFPRHVLRWYAVLGVIMFGVALNIPQLATFRAQLLFNELVLFLGAPLLMIWKYRLDPRVALSLRPVRPAAWLGVLLLIPSSLIVAIGIFRLANLVFPVPQQILEQFSREIMPKDIPVWQVLLFVSILPGLCEEIAFRGTLLYGLRRKLRPVPLALTIGLIFGLFHVALFRIIPTAFLGIVLTAVALLTGSIFPGMVVHAGNNALSLWLFENRISMADLTWKWHLAAAAVFAFALFILGRWGRTVVKSVKR